MPKKRVAAKRKRAPAQKRAPVKKKKAVAKKRATRPKRVVKKSGGSLQAYVDSAVQRTTITETELIVGNEESFRRNRGKEWFVQIAFEREKWGPPFYDLGKSFFSDARLTSFYAPKKGAPPGAGQAILCRALLVLLELNKIQENSLIVLEADYSAPRPGKEPGGLRRYYERLGFQWLQRHAPVGDEGGLMGNTVGAIFAHCSES